MQLFSTIYGGKTPELEVYIQKSTPDLPERMKRFDSGVRDSPRKEKILKYAQWSYLRYLKYLAADDVDAVEDPIACWKLLRKEQREAYILFEAWRHGARLAPQGLAAILLLRSGWNGDIAIDYVVSMEGDNDKYGTKYAGRKLVVAAMKFARQANGEDKHVFVETAQDSTDWWGHINPKQKLGPFLVCGTDFIRYNNIVDATTQLDLFMLGIGAEDSI